MRSSGILLAALVGVASAGIPKWPFQWSNTASGVSGGGEGPTAKPHLPVVFPSGYPIDHNSKKDMLPSEGPPRDNFQKYHPMPTAEKYHQRPTGEKYHPMPTGDKYHQRPTGEKYHPMPTGTGHGGSPPLTSGPRTTTVTKTSDVTSK